MNSPGRVFKQDPHKINEKITAHEVRLVGDNVEVGVYSLSKAILIAQDLELDLVEISPNATPPVCKIWISASTNTNSKNANLRRAKSKRSSKSKR